MNKKIIYLALMIFLVGTVLAYSADSYDSVELILDETENYVAQDYDSVDLVLDIGEAPPEDSCTYTSGIWNIDCSDNCVIDSLVNLGNNNITLNDNGYLAIRANFTNLDSIIISDGCEIHIYPEGGLIW